MPLIEWCDDWQIGFEVIDYDHKMLVNITNQIYDIRHMPGIRNRQIKQVLDLLVQYVQQHFAREEEIFCRTMYPLSQKHIAMHRELERAVRNITTLFDTHPDMLNFEEVMEFLRRWLVNHILKHDMGYAKYLVLLKK